MCLCIIRYALCNGTEIEIYRKFSEPNGAMVIRERKAWTSMCSSFPVVSGSASTLLCARTDGDGVAVSEVAVTSESVLEGSPSFESFDFCRMEKWRYIR